jgi:hypothetical protein
MSRVRIAYWVALAATLTAGVARGDDGKTTPSAAQQLFSEGKALAAAGKFADACPKFAAAADLSATAGVRLNLGDCYDKLGRTASAWTRYGEALALAQKSGDAAAADLARSRLAALKPRLSYLEVRVPPESAVSELAVDRDGDNVQQAAWGTPVPVDPGNHAVRATAPGRTAWTTTVSVKEPGEHVATVPVLPPATTTAAATAPPGLPEPASTAGVGASEPETPQRSGWFTGPGGTQRVLAVTSGVLGVAGIAVGSYFGATMLARKSDYQRNQDATGKCIDPECQTASHDAVSAGNVATVAFIAGGVALGAGTVLWLTAPKESNAARGIAVAPLLGPQGAGIAATGRW